MKEEAPGRQKTRRAGDKHPLEGAHHAGVRASARNGVGLLCLVVVGPWACFNGGATDYGATELSGQSTASLPGSTPGAVDTNTDLKPQTQTQMAPQPAKPTVTFLGRTVALDPLNPDLQRMAWAGVAAGGHFSGTQISATLADAAAVRGSGTTRALVDVVLDGNLATTLNVGGAARPYLLASKLSDNEHVVWLYKRTEPDYGQINFLGFETDGGTTLLSPPTPPTRHLLVMGASSEVGFGVTGNDQNCATQPILVQNQQLAWPQRTAELLGADLENLSLSARGLLATASTVPDPNHTSSALFFQTDPVLENNPWDPQRRPIDAVMFNLGANDWHFFGEGPPPKAQFEGTFVALIRRIRAAYPKARIYLTLIATATGDERATFAAYYQDIAATLKAQGDDQVFYFPFTPGPGLACWGHPDPALHLQMAKEMAARIAQDLGWPPPR